MNWSGPSCDGHDPPVMFASRISTSAIEASSMAEELSSGNSSSLSSNRGACRNKSVLSNGAAVLASLASQCLAMASVRLFPIRHQPGGGFFVPEHGTREQAQRPRFRLSVRQSKKHSTFGDVELGRKQSSPFHRPVCGRHTRARSRLANPQEFLSDGKRPFSPRRRDSLAREQPRISRRDLSAHD
jgi:hypothetical protein